jgi:hypothetical protein
MTDYIHDMYSDKNRMKLDFRVSTTSPNHSMAVRQIHYVSTVTTRALVYMLAVTPCITIESMKLLIHAHTHTHTHTVCINVYIIDVSVPVRWPGHMWWQWLADRTSYVLMFFIWRLIQLNLDNGQSPLTSFHWQVSSQIQAQTNFQTIRNIPKHGGQSGDVTPGHVHGVLGCRS